MPKMSTKLLPEKALPVLGVVRHPDPLSAWFGQDAVSMKRALGRRCRIRNGMPNKKAPPVLKRKMLCETWGI